MKAAIDRIEGQMAVLLVVGDEAIKLNLPLSLLSEGCKDGDVLNMAIERDLEETQRTRESIQPHGEAEEEKRRQARDNRLRRQQNNAYAGELRAWPAFKPHRSDFCLPPYKLAFWIAGFGD